LPIYIEEKVPVSQNKKIPYKFIVYNLIYDTTLIVVGATIKPIKIKKTETNLSTEK
jgi:hypothetical protein